MIRNLRQITDSVDIVRLIGNHVELRRNGAAYTGLCPFHEEKTPSFSVSHQKGLFHCFGCGAGGDAIEFLMRFKKLTFVEAVEDAAKNGGIEIEFEKNRMQTESEYRENKALNDLLFSVYDQATKVIALKSDESCGKIDVAGREYDGELLHRFLVGFSVKGILHRTHDVAEIPMSGLIAAGLMKKSEKHDGHYEPFSERIIFPIRDRQGRVVAWGGRKMPDAPDKSPKYLNSQESNIYQKSKILYGLFEAETSIDKHHRAIITEGYTDVLTMHQYGFTNTVGTCGTAFTADHAQTIGRYCDKITLLFDGDQAGITGAIRAVENGAKYLAIEVAFIPSDGGKSDPDSYLRENGADAMREILASGQDAVLWYCMIGWSKTDIYAQNQALVRAAKILASIHPSQRSLYVKKLAGKDFFGAIRKELEALIDEELERNRPKGTDFTDKEEESIVSYGIFEQGGRYCIPSEEPGRGIPLSNFVIQSMTLVVGNKSSERILSIRHSSGQVINSRIESETFTQFNQFQAWIESQGQLYFYDLAIKFWNNIRRYVIDNMRTVYPITRLGQHKEGFYVWQNGATMPDGTFHPVGEGGLIEYKGITYMLTHAVNVQNAHADDISRRSSGRYFHFDATLPVPDIKDFGQKMQTAYGRKAVIGLSYILAIPFRDIIQSNQDWFPILNIFGMPGSGKNKYFEMLIAFWGPDGAFVDLTNATEKSLPRSFSQAVNAPTWCDEYRNELSDEMLAILANAYNGSGRNMAAYDGTNKTNTLDVTTAVLVSGEHRPTRRAALYTRMIAQETKSSEFSQEQTDAYEDTREVARSGALTHIIAQLITYRDTVSEQFPSQYRLIKADLKRAFWGKKIEVDRLIDNYAAILSVSQILQDAGFSLPFDMQIALDEAYKGIELQNAVIGSEDPLAQWWRIIAALYEGRQLQPRFDVIFDTTSKVQVLKDNKGSESVEVVFDENRELMFLRLDKAHGLYLEHLQKQTRSQGLALGTLQHYLFATKSFVGVCRAKKFGSQTLRCLVFDTQKIASHTGVEFRQPERDLADNPF